MEETGLDVDFGSSPEFGTVSYQTFASSKVFGVWGSKRLGLVEQGVGRAQCGWKFSGRLLAEVVEIESGMDDFHVRMIFRKRWQFSISSSNGKIVC